VPPSTPPAPRPSEPLLELVVPGELERDQVAPKLCHCRRPAEHDVRPGPRERRRERERVLARPLFPGGRRERIGRSTRGEAPVGERLLDQDHEARLVRTSERLLGCALVEVPGGLHGVETAAVQSTVDGGRLLWSGDAEADPDPAGAQCVELLAHGRVVQHAAVEGGRVDLVDPEPIAEQLVRLAPLRPEVLHRQVLHLVLGGIDPPVRRVAIAPLRAHGDLAALQSTTPEPRPEERLGTAVRTRGVEPAHSALVRGVEHVVRRPLHLLHARVGHVLAVAKVDVCRTPERGEAERDRRASHVDSLRSDPGPRAELK
jgi:hypothetical protein